ncbi:MAG: exodeoxyribonuclease VII large subunit [Planctomycetota bacterium]
MASRSLFDGSVNFPPNSEPRGAKNPDTPGAVSVSELVAQIKGCVEPPFTNVWVAGEIVEFRGIAASGHAYFALKDAASLVRAKMWRSSIAKLKFPIENGAAVLVRGNVEMYAPRGELSLTIDKIVPRGIGEAAAAFEALRKKLLAEGLFAIERKRPIPYFPKAIGLVTSGEGAAIRDFLKHLFERFPTRVVVLPTVVQGNAAPASVAAAIELLSEEAKDLGLEVLAVVRGGGGMEDLAAFNSEVVARAIVSSTIPVVTGIGHEIDTTIADLAADRRAKTPTDAANVLVPDRESLFTDLSHLWQRLSESMDRKIDSFESEMIQLRRATALVGPEARVKQYILQIDSLRRSMASNLKERIGAFESVLERSRGRLATNSPRATLADWERSAEIAGRRLMEAAKNKIIQSEGLLQLSAARLEGKSPVAILARGYSIARRAGSPQFLTKAGELAPGDIVETRLSSGEFTSRVLEIRPSL